MIIRMMGVPVEWTGAGKASAGMLVATGLRPASRRRMDGAKGDSAGWVGGAGIEAGSLLLDQPDGGGAALGPGLRFIAEWAGWV